MSNPVTRFMAGQYPDAFSIIAALPAWKSNVGIIENRVT